MVQQLTFETAEGRRAWAFAAILGGCIIMTVFAAVGVYLVSGNVFYSFCLAMAAHVQILVGLTAFGFLLGRKMTINANVKEGSVSVTDAAHAGAQAAADAAQVVSDQLEESK